jgi:hypothetical protein
MRFSISFCGGLATMLFFSRDVAATCTNWTSTYWSFQGTDSIDTTNVIPIANLSCPSSSNEKCYLPRQTYEVPLHRTLNISVDASELDSIFSRMFFFHLSPAPFGSHYELAASLPALETVVAGARFALDLIPDSIC